MRLSRLFLSLLMAIGLVAHATAQYSSASSGCTSGAIDTSGANFLVASVSFLVGGTPVLSDSKGNTWTARTTVNGGTSAIKEFYVTNPTVGSGHTFTISG